MISVAGFWISAIHHLIVLYRDTKLPIIALVLEVGEFLGIILNRYSYQSSGAGKYNPGSAGIFPLFDTHGGSSFLLKGRTQP